MKQKATHLYVLDENGRPKLEPDVMTWANWFENADRQVADERVGKVRVSTLFLGIDHAFGSEPSVLWETMTFGPAPWDQRMTRCGGSREQAEAMHAEMVARVRETQKAFAPAPSGCSPDERT